MIGMDTFGENQVPGTWCEVPECLDFRKADAEKIEDTTLPHEESHIQFMVVPPMSPTFRKWKQKNV